MTSVTVAPVTVARLRVLLVSGSDQGSDQGETHGHAQQLRNAGAEVVLLPNEATTAAVVVAATQEAVDEVRCPSRRVDAIRAALITAGLETKVSAASDAYQADQTDLADQTSQKDRKYGEKAP